MGTIFGMEGSIRGAIFGYTVLVILNVFVHGDQFNEELFIKPLPPTHLYANFQFVTLVDNDCSRKLYSSMFSTLRFMFLIIQAMLLTFH